MEYPFVRDGATAIEIAERLLLARRHQPVTIAWPEQDRQMEVVATIDADGQYVITAWFINDERVEPFPVPDAVSCRISELGRE